MSKPHSNGNGRGIPAACYIRMSSDKQDASPEQQRDELTKLAARGGYHVVARILRRWHQWRRDRQAARVPTDDCRRAKGQVQGHLVLGPGSIRSVRSVSKPASTFTRYGKLASSW